jgi:proteasome accessory factor B
VTDVSRSRTERLVNLVICLLSTRRFLTAAQIAATVSGYEHDAEDPREHEAFQRKFERDKAELRALGVPLETGTASVFDTEPGYRIARRDWPSCAPVGWTSIRTPPSGWSPWWPWTPRSSR